MPPQQVVDTTTAMATKVAPLVVPRFDDEDDSSSSDEEEPAIKPATSLNKRYYNVPSNNNDEDDHDESTVSSYKANQGQPQQVFQGDMRWDRVQELQDLTNANATLTSEAQDLRQQVKALQIQLEAQAPVPGLDVDAVQDILLEKDNIEHDVRDVKIVHQAKTLRSLKRSLQREKQIAADAVKQCKAFEATNKKLEEEVDTLKLKLQRFQARATADKVITKGNAGAQGVNQQQEPEEHASSSDNVSDSGSFKKLCEELKSKNTSLQHELKKTQRALVREVGDDVPLEDIIGEKAAGSTRFSKA
ncbi:hypothetical protein ON010_g9718 [Phytophthora cinnamomi]|nr:hypothetical protein ON010_g9718 [Phytophthora cinnamomi]